MALPLPPGDPLWRAVFARAAAAGLVVVLASTAGLGWGLAAATLAALAVATELVHRASPLRRKVSELGGADPGERAGFDALAERVDEARERLAQAARKAERERDDLFSVLEAASEGILVLGHHHRIELINDSARRLLDPAVDPLGRSIHEVARESELIEFAEALRRGEAPEPTRLELVRGGVTRSVHLSGELVPGALRSRAVVVLHDLTDLQHLERVRTDFVANVTHELRSPLASILGYAETLAEEGGLAAPDAGDFLGRILRNSRRLDDIIRDLIELSRLEHATSPEAEPADPRALVEKVAADFRDQAAEKDIALEVKLDGLPPTLALDAGLVHQALSNLVDNAVKYTPEKGRVTIAASLAHHPASGGEHLEIAVTDTGPGISPEHRLRVFERFYRVDTARSRALGGTGLGLAIVKHAAALQGGRVRLESTPGAGSTFRLELPLERPRP